MFSKEVLRVTKTKLVSIESQTEQSLLSGKSETRIFVKMYGSGNPSILVK